jgi:uncharacterized membrane protein YeaQ/YmgE (transglycosylase-associated protein family)
MEIWWRCQARGLVFIFALVVSLILNDPGGKGGIYFTITRPPLRAEGNRLDSAPVFGLDSICKKTAYKRSNMLHIIWSIIVGFIIGLVARAIMPGAQHMGFVLTTLLGIGGSIVGGLIGRLISKPKEGQPVHPAGIIMSIIGALILLFVWGKIQ